MSKKKYSRIPNEVDWQVAFSQGAYALDLAAEIAYDKEDTETLLNVGEMFIMLGARLSEMYSVSEEEEEEVVDGESEQGLPVIGFAHPGGDCE